MSEAASVTDMLGNDGPLPEVTFRGKAYRVGHPCPDAVAHAEIEVARAALENLKGLAGALDAGEYAQARKDTLADIQARLNAYGGPMFDRATQGPDGDALVLFACLKLNHPEITMRAVRDMMRDADAGEGLELALAVVSPGFFSEAVGTLAKPPEVRAFVALQTAASVAANLVRREEVRRQMREGHSRTASPPTAS